MLEASKAFIREMRVATCRDRGLREAVQKSQTCKANVIREMIDRKEDEGCTYPPAIYHIIDGCGCAREHKDGVDRRSLRRFFLIFPFVYPNINT